MIGNQQHAPLGARVAIVTGGSRGIGRAISVALARAGVAVAVNYRRDEAAAAELVEGLRAEGLTASAFAASMSSNDDIDRLVAEVEAELGAAEIVVNCAGTASRGHSVVDTEPAELGQLMAVNAFGPHRLAQLVLPGMRQRGIGHLIMISSTATTIMAARGAPYNMAKAAMEALAFTLAAEEAPHGVRVNVIAPGLVATEMGRRLAKAMHGVADVTELDAASPFGRVCRPEDIAAVVAFLVGPGGSYLNGERITVDGGAERANRTATPRLADQGPSLDRKDLAGDIH